MGLSLRVCLANSNIQRYASFFWGCKKSEPNLRQTFTSWEASGARKILSCKASEDKEVKKAV